MESLGLNEIREKYLKFFESKGHLRMPSFSLVPQNDKSLLLINAGMAPLKPYFTGLQVPPSKRVTTCQKCIRTGDIENVGKTSRHGTFFEMLGNFSFGDYFKMEIIPWAWEFITEVLNIPKDKLYVTIYLDDDEAYDIWTKKTDVDPKRIFRLGKEDNFWEHGLGPCGPCSEIHFDRGEGQINSVEDFVKAGDEDRVIEFWNLVFTQFDKDENGNYNKLQFPNIDTGMGIERIATIMQGVNSIFEVDTIKNIIEEVSSLSGVKYGENSKTDISIRIITDHVRSITFLISDGVLPSNEGRGYVLRRLLRRAARHGKILGLNEAFLYKLCTKVIEDSRLAYPELDKKSQFIKKVIKIEEERFIETIDSGMDILRNYIEEMKNDNNNILTGEKAFKLYDTYGFPIELTSEILMEKGMHVDMDGFNSEMKMQKQRARAARAEQNYMGAEIKAVDNIESEFKTAFTGYNNIKDKGIVKFIIKDEEFVSKLSRNEEGIVVIDRTPFYAEMGGQVGDRGVLCGSNCTAEINNCKKNIGGKIVHYVKVNEGTIELEDEVVLKVDKARRESISRNHTATHMLQEALREVIGNHVHQSGSFVDNERLRFDFTHFSAVSKEELEKIENIVNEKIMEVITVKTDIMSITQAKQSGAMALFDDKYTDEVRVVSVGEFSKELCGGTHISNTGEIGLFKIISETGVAAGVRRIEALTGINSIEYIRGKNKLIEETCGALKCSDNDIVHRIQLQLDELKQKDKEIEILKGKLTSGVEDEIFKNVKVIGEIKFVTSVLNEIDSESLRNICDKVKEKLGEGLVVLGSTYENKVNFIAMATKGAVAQGVHCGKIIKEVASIAGGGGGGRPDMAQAGGKSPEKINQAIGEVENILGKIVK